MTIEQIKLVNKYSDQILNLIDNADEYTRSDIQGIADSIVMNILNDK